MDEAKKSVYIESTIPSYATARESSNALNLLRKAQTQAFWDQERHKYRFYVSQDVVDECADGDPDASRRRMVFLEGIEVLPDIAGRKELAAVYRTLLGIPERAAADCSHLAYCVLGKIDYLLSWNCAHLGTQSQRRAQRYNDAHGLWTPALVTPETIYIEEEENYGRIR
jgi:hypothetical protein